MSPDTLIFDLDGTLTDTFAACFAAFREALLAVTHRSFTDEEILARFGPSEDGMFQRWMPDRWEACLQLYLASYEREHRRLARVFPGIQAALDTLKARQIPLAVVTGKGAQSAAISLAQLGLDHYFDTVETGSPEGGIKPRCLRRVLTHWGVTPDRVAYLGDVPSDIEASRAVGIIPLAAAWEKRSDAAALRALEPLAVFDTVAQFIAWVERTVEPRGVQTTQPLRGS
jgi:HAD superfamily hydrolase (TIGR01509 family)